MLKFKRSELEAWIAYGKVKTLGGVEQDNNTYLTSQKTGK